MPRLLASLLLWFAVVAASPADDAWKLIEAGKEKEAFAIAEQAAARNDAEAIDLLARFYDNGRVVKKHKKQAADLFRRAGEMGNKHAQWRLGVMLDVGDGIEANADEAFRWISRAASQDYGRAHVSLGLMFAMGRGTAVDYAKSFHHYREAARMREAHGFYGIGILHARGEGFAQNPTEALAWMLVSASLGDEEAQSLINRNGFAEADAAAAVVRARQIALEYGLTGLKFEFHDKRPDGKKATT